MPGFEPRPPLSQSGTLPLLQVHNCTFLKELTFSSFRESIFAYHYLTSLVWSTAAAERIDTTAACAYGQAGVFLFHIFTLCVHTYYYKITIYASILQLSRYDLVFIGIDYTFDLCISPVALPNLQGASRHCVFMI